MPHTRRTLLKAAAAFAAFPAIARALDIPAKVRTGTIKDVEYIVILMQENRSFDHYFGAMNGVQGFGDRFPIPAIGNRTVFAQPREEDQARLIAPFALNTTKDFRLMRVEGTPHSFKDAQAAWDHGRMSNWPAAKHNHSMGYFTREDIPFQYALADAFTLCDAYFCSMHSGTNPNRVFHWTGKNTGPNGPVIDNGYDELKNDPKGHGGYDWTTYPERLSAAGVSWQVYQNMKDNFTDNPLVGFKTYRAADKASGGKLAELATRSVRTRDLDKLKADVLAGTLPQVSWIVGTAEGSEHPSTSSPAQGADYTSKVLDALTANPEVWAKTVFLINFDENDGYFDHVPPPAPPSLDKDGAPLGFADGAEQEYHQGDDQYRNRPYGLGPRVPMYVISPWSRGGYVASEVFDHTSVIRFIEARFGVHEPNISPWRRAVCGDLTSCFDFKTPNDQPFFAAMPHTTERADRARKLGGETMPPLPDALIAPVQEQGLRKRRATPYRIDCDLRGEAGLRRLVFINWQQSLRAAVFHLYDLNKLYDIPKRYTIGPDEDASYSVPKGKFDLWVTGPNSFHRHFKGSEIPFFAFVDDRGLIVKNETHLPLKLSCRDNAYGHALRSIEIEPGEGAEITVPLVLAKTHGWYDLTLSVETYSLRLSGHIEDGKPSMSDPAAFGLARLQV
ncbi:phosphocholine-specific phospholipase C [Asticcacaulis machinosus]|uniref:phospholipase C n=1 Tax=Asticcacaulis machinosus TaxID=2984211 RepID=A0ABT5HK69_9CAUL|nr:phospholipase C, phosphocholine-specific [Asticcacaulis machinosus]MDC7676651.1 phospholipase C, phosphocholine-specific [Asticcacaulis machinosus]